ncbi:MAG: aminomethyl-transferring glycine dehydrogenase [Akkermansia sp.]
MPATPDFLNRHVGSIGTDRQSMLDTLGYSSLDALVKDIVPTDIQLQDDLALNPALSEADALNQLRGIMSKNKLLKSYIGQGYYGTLTPSVVLRNILENPGWYTAYTPYQPEISQGRLEMLMNFQTMVSSLTGLPVTNASLLDEGTAAAEAMMMCIATKPKTDTFFVADTCHPQTIELIRTRSEPRGIKVITGDWQTFDPSTCSGLTGVLVQYPDTLGKISSYDTFFAKVHAAGALCIVAADLLALTMLREPATFGTDICIGNSQRFGVPMGFGGPHAGYMSVTEALKRRMPGRLVGMSIDANGRPGYRLSLQTREQHIRRDKATSNICTAQALLAIMSAFYAAYHGPLGLIDIAKRTHALTQQLAQALSNAGMQPETSDFFDTITFGASGKADALVAAALKSGYNIRRIDDNRVAVSFDETTEPEDVVALATALTGKSPALPCLDTATSKLHPSWCACASRQTPFCTEKFFNDYHSETDMMRYMHRLEVRDLALNEAMIPLGSCTMKLNAASIMMPITWQETAALHPFVPADQAQGSLEMLESLSEQLAIVTGFAAVSMQPNSGAAGEYAGLMSIRRYLQSIGQGHRNICLIPTSAHGTNPASAVMAGYQVVTVKCDDGGNIDIDDLKIQATKHADNLACIMVTYPSTHGVYEPTIRELCQIVHSHGAQVYMDGANMNAQVALTNPGFIGADVCHLNLHKTFAIPHGGGGPGIGSIGLAKHLVPFKPGHFTLGTVGAVSSAAYGSASIAPISWMYLTMMGTAGLKTATAMAILNANYIAKKLSSLYPVLYSGNKGLVAHECILDTRNITHDAGLTVDDIAKRLMDYGFHAPTMSFPVPGTLMIEPTESEPKVELDRFIEAMTCIHAEITAIAQGKVDANDNVMKNAPHTAEAVSSDTWSHPYSRTQAAYPVPSLKIHKFWPYSGRIDNVYGDRNLVCTCDTIESYEEAIQ